MTKKINKAMFLAAGLGTRLKPLTLTTPKPLLPLGGCLLIDHQLNYLRSSGVGEIMINLHHLGDKIRSHVGDGSKYGLKIYYSEEPVILGTGGGIKNVQDFFGNEPFICLNCDALMDANLKKLIEFHFSKMPSATMVLKKLAPQDSYNAINIDDQNFVTAFGTGKYFYTGIQILGPKIFEALPAKGTVSCLIKDGYEKLITKKAPVAAFIYEGYFNDLGTMERYEAAKKDIAENRFKL